MNLETKITIYKFTPQVFTLTRKNGSAELGLKTLSLTHETETSKNRQGQSENCFSNVLAKRVWLHLLNVPL